MGVSSICNLQENKVHTEEFEKQYTGVHSGFDGEVDTSLKFLVPTPKTTVSGPQPKLETDVHRLSQRQKQIDYGKNTLGYEQYLTMVPRNMRKKDHPRTPDIHQVCSKRNFDGQIKKWRRLLHKFDGESADESSDTSNSSGLSVQT